MCCLCIVSFRWVLLKLVYREGEDSFYRAVVVILVEIPRIEHGVGNVCSAVSS